MSDDMVKAIKEFGDLHALMIEVNRAWVERHYRDARFASVLVDRGEGRPTERHVIIPSASASPSPEIRSGASPAPP